VRKAPGFSWLKIGLFVGVDGRQVASVVYAFYVVGDRSWVTSA
jgi:hypothetical protein